MDLKITLTITVVGVDLLSLANLLNLVKTSFIVFNCLTMESL